MVENIMPHIIAGTHAAVAVRDMALRGLYCALRAVTGAVMGSVTGAVAVRPVGLLWSDTFAC
jgi:hypothetical protein